MDIVDTHCHACLSWYEPVEMLVREMDLNGVRRACLVQIKGQYDNTYQASLIARHPDRFASVVHLDAGRPDAVQELERLAAGGAVGLRLTPETRSPGPDPLAIWRKASSLGLPVTTGGGDARELLESRVEDVIRALPGLTVILEHLGSVNRPDGEGAPFALRRRVYELSRYPNVCVKFHGLGEFCTRNMPVTEPFPFEGRVLPLLDMAVEAFGPGRMMWGSDYPPVSSREGYGNALRFPREHLARYGQDAVEAAFGGTAMRVYRLG